MINHKDWDINEHATGRFRKDPDTGLDLPIMAATFQNGLNDIEPDGSFVPCDMGVEEAAIGVTTHKVKRGRWGELRFSDTASLNKHLCKIKYKDGKGISFKYLGGNSDLPDITNGKPVFVADNGVTIEHTPTYKGVKIELVISNPETAPNEHSFSMKAYGQSYSFIEQDGGIVARGEDQKPITIHAPYAADANGDEGPVTMMLTGEVGGYMTFKKVVDEAWLRQAVAPVRIDPNVTIQDGVDGGVIEDNTIVSNSPSTNSGTGIHLAANNYYGAGKGQWALIKVALSSYSTTIPVSGKFLARPSASNAVSLPGKCTKLLKAWGEYTSTWNNRDTGIAWETSGAQGATDRAGSVECTFDMLNSGTTDIPITVSTLAEWVGGTNYGVITDGDNAPLGKYVHFGSSEHGSVPIQFYYEYTEGPTNIGPLGDNLSIASITASRRLISNTTGRQVVSNSIERRVI